MLPGEKYIDVAGVKHIYREIESYTEADSMMGRSDSKRCIITLAKEMPEDMKEVILIHEWLHALLDHYGLEHSEGIINVLSIALYNKGLRIEVCTQGI